MAVKVAQIEGIDSFGGHKTVPSPVTKQQDPIEIQQAISQPVEAKRSFIEENVEVVKAVAKLSSAEQALISAASSSFVAQLFGSYSENSAKVFIQENKSKAGPLLRYRTEHKGKSWFVVVSGPFESKAVAKKAVGKLPAKLRNQQPWVRSIEPIQELLNAR